MKVFYAKWLPVVKESRCTGGKRRVLACGPNSLEVLNRVAVLVRPNTCGSEGHCISACSEDAIQIGWVEMQGDRTHGTWAPGGRVWPGRVRGGRA